MDAHDAESELWGRLIGEAADKHDRYCLGLTKDVDVAEDLRQDALLRAWRHRHTYKADKSFRAWLFRITYNAWVDIVRRDAASPVVGAEVDGIAAADPEEIALATEFIERAIRVLTDVERRVARLDGSEESDAEIARSLGIAIGALHVRRHQVKRKLAALHEWWKGKDIEEVALILAMTRSMVRDLVARFKATDGDEDTPQALGSRS